MSQQELHIKFGEAFATKLCSELEKKGAYECTPEVPDDRAGCAHTTTHCLIRVACNLVVVVLVVLVVAEVVVAASAFVVPIAAVVVVVGDSG